MPVTKSDIYQWQWHISSDKMIIIKVFVMMHYQVHIIISVLMHYQVHIIISVHACYFSDIICVIQQCQCLGTLSVICVIYQCRCLETLQLIMFWRAPPRILKISYSSKNIDKIRTSFRNPSKFHENFFFFQNL